MNRVAHIRAVLLDELGCPDGNGAGVAIGGGAHDITDGVLAQRRLILLFAVVDVLVIATTATPLPIALSMAFLSAGRASTERCK